MAAAVNAEWSELTAAQRCEACDGQASRKIFLRKIEETCRRGGRLVGPVARTLGPGRGVPSNGRATLSIIIEKKAISSALFERLRRGFRRIEKKKKR